MTSRIGPLKRLAAWLSDLRLAIVLLLLIALAGAVGTGIPQVLCPKRNVMQPVRSLWTRTKTN